MSVYTSSTSIVLWEHAPFITPATWNILWCDLRLTRSSQHRKGLRAVKLDNSPVPCVVHSTHPRSRAVAIKTLFWCRLTNLCRAIILLTHGLRADHSCIIFSWKSRAGKVRTASDQLSSPLPSSSRLCLVHPDGCCQGAVHLPLIPRSTLTAWGSYTKLFQPESHHLVAISSFGTSHHTYER